MVKINNGIAKDSPSARVQVSIQTGKVFQGGGLMDLSHRRRNRLETCLKKKEMWTKNSLCWSAVEQEKNVTSYEIFRKIRVLVRTGTAHRWRSSKKNTWPQYENKSNNLEPRFQTPATYSRCLEDTKTAVALPH